MAQIKVNEDVLQKLKKVAEEKGMTNGQVISLLLDFPLQEETASQGDGDVPDNIKNYIEERLEALGLTKRDRVPSPNYFHEECVRTKGEILSDIRGAEAERDDELNNCQDAETTRKLEKKWKAELDTLWAEYNALTGPKV